MAEYKINMILDSGSYKLSYSKGGKQNKVTIGNEKNITVMAARKISSEVEGLLNSELKLEHMEKMHAINSDAVKCGYPEGILKYQNVSIELAVRILYPDEYEAFKNNNEYCKIKRDEKPLEILNIGCTGSGKTRFILSAVLSKEALKNFVPALTSLRETTACSIIYHINCTSVKLGEEFDFKVVTQLKTEEEIISSIRGLIQEAVEEYIVTVKENCKTILDLSQLCEKCRGSVEKRLEMNYDKTFGLGIRKVNKPLASLIEELTKSVLVDFYGNSKSIDRLAKEDCYFIIKQLVRDYEDEQFDIGSDVINQMVAKFDISDIVSEVYGKLMQDLEAYNAEYTQSAVAGGSISYCGRTRETETLLYLSHVFGNKTKQRKGDFYTIEPIVKNAEFYFESAQISLDREIILSDSVGINQGQKDAARINEVVFYRVQESVQSRKPDIILYHTKLNNKDDYMLDIIKRLNAQGYSRSTYIVSGRLDEVWSTYLADNGIDKEVVTEEDFEEFIDVTKQIYIESDSVTLNSIIGNNYYICDKTNSLYYEYTYAKEYTCSAVLEQIIDARMQKTEGNYLFDDVDFMDIIQRYNVAGNVYQQFLNSIPIMIPLAYRDMRWNTLQKAIEELCWNGFGFDVLYPAFNIKNAIANELNREEIKIEFEKKFAEKAEEMKKRYLLEVAEVAQIVLVTEYREFMKNLLDMRYDSKLRTNLSLTMTDDRKQNLHLLYLNCMKQNGIQGAYAMQMVFHIAWIRTLDFFRRQAQ